MNKSKVAYVDMPKAYLQFNHTHIPVGKSVDVESVAVVSHTSENSGKTSKVFEVKLKDIGLSIKVMPTRALESGLAIADAEGVTWEAKSLTRSEENVLSA